MRSTSSRSMRAGRRGPSCASHPRTVHPRRSRRHFFATAPAATRDRGLAGRRPAAAPMVPDPVLGEIGVVGVGGPEHVADAGIVAGPRVGVLDEERDRGAGGGPLEHPGEDPHLVRLAPLGGMATPAGAAPVEIGLEVGFREGEPGRTAVHHAPDRRAVALAERGHREVGSEGVAGHERPAPSFSCQRAIVRNARRPARRAPGPRHVRCGVFARHASRECSWARRPGNGASSGRAVPRTPCLRKWLRGVKSAEMPLEPTPNHGRTPSRWG